MKTSKLGSSDLNVPIICLGTMTWGQQNTLEEAHAQLDYAVNERGITFIDTAEIYPIPPSSEKQGLTEEYIGKWLKKHGNRESLIIATKVSPASLIRTRDVGNPPKLDKKSIVDAVEGSLKRLDTDYIDLYQIHWPVRQTNFFGARTYEHKENDDSTPIEETLEALQELVKAGKIRNIGVSNETPWGVSEYLRLHREKNLPKIVSIQNQYSLTNRTFEIGLSEFCKREDIGMLPYSTLNMGVLTGKYLDGAKPEGARFSLDLRNSTRYNPDNPYAQKAIKEYVELAKKHNIDPAQLAIAFAASRNFVSSVIIGASKIDQLKSCIDAGDIELSAEILSDIDTLYNTYPDVTV
jgi:aryl-alcohol dehydrogenase-like predicted oxidoreductase